MPVIEVLDQIVMDIVSHGVVVTHNVIVHVVLKGMMIRSISNVIGCQMIGKTVVIG